MLLPRFPFRRGQILALRVGNDTADQIGAPHSRCSAQLGNGIGGGNRALAAHLIFQNHQVGNVVCGDIGAAVLGNLSQCFRQGHLPEPAAVGGKSVLGVSDGQLSQGYNLALLHTLQSSEKIRLLIGPNRHRLPGIGVAVVHPGFRDGESRTAAGAPLVGGRDGILGTIIVHGPIVFDCRAVFQRDTGFTGGIQVGIAIFVILGKIGNHPLPDSVPLRRDHPGGFSLRRFHRFIGGAVFGAPALQGERDGFHLGNLRIQNGTAPFFDERIIPNAGNGVGLLEPELLHSTGKVFLAQIFAGGDKLVAIQGEGSGAVVAVLNLKLGAGFIHHLDLLNHRLGHIIGKSVFIIDIDIELQIQGGDVLGEAGQGLRVLLVLTGQHLVGALLGGIHRQLLKRSVLIGDQNRHLNFGAVNISQVGGAPPDFADVDLSLFPMDIGNGSAVGRTIGQHIVGTCVDCLVIGGLHGFPDEIDIPAALLVIEGQLQILGQCRDGACSKGDGLLVLIFQRIGQKNVLIADRSIFTRDGFAVDHLGRLAVIEHLIDARVRAAFQRVTPQRHDGFGPLGRVVELVLPVLRGGKVRGACQALQDGAAVVAVQRVIAVVTGGVTVIGNIVARRRLLNNHIVVFLAVLVQPGQVVCRNAPGITAGGCHLQLGIRNRLIAAVPGTAAQLQRERRRVRGAPRLRITVIQPGDCGGKSRGLPIGEGIAGVIGGHHIPLRHILRHHRVFQGVASGVHAGQAAVDILPLGSVGSIEAGKRVDAQRFQGSSGQIRPLALFGSILQLKVSGTQRRTGRIVFVHPGNRKGVGAVLHVVDGGDGHRRIRRDGAGCRSVCCGGILRARNLILRFEFIARHRCLHSPEAEPHRDIQRSRLLIGGLHCSGKLGQLRLYPIGVFEGQLERELHFCLVAHHFGCKGQRLGFDLQLQGGDHLSRVRNGDGKAAVLIFIIGILLIHIHKNIVGGDGNGFAILQCQLFGHVGKLEAAAALAVMGQHEIERIAGQAVLGKARQLIGVALLILAVGNELDVLVKFQRTEKRSPIRSVLGFLVKGQVRADGKIFGLVLPLLQSESLRLHLELLRHTTEPRRFFRLTAGLGYLRLTAGFGYLRLGFLFQRRKGRDNRPFPFLIFLFLEQDCKFLRSVQPERQRQLSESFSLPGKAHCQRRAVSQLFQGALKSLRNPVVLRKLHIRQFCRQQQGEPVPRRHRTGLKPQGKTRLFRCIRALPE